MRLFVAIDVPTEIRELLERGVAPIRAENPRARWVPTQNQHVTIKFLGSTFPRLVESVKRIVADVASAHATFQTRVAELGAFPSARRARVLWVGLEDARGNFAAIAGELDEALMGDFAPEKRAFTAHLTLARFDPPAALEGAIEDIGVPARAFTVDGLVLYRSHLRRPAPVYEALGAWPLGEPT